MNIDVESTLNWVVPRYAGTCLHRMKNLFRRDKPKPTKVVSGTKELATGSEVRASCPPDTNCVQLLLCRN